MTSFRSPQPPPSPPLRLPQITHPGRLLMDIHAAWAELGSAAGDLIELVVATLASPQVAESLDCRPLWLMLVGPPSSAKTEAVTAARLYLPTYLLDTLTENSFISGFVPPRGQSKDLLQELIGKILLIKDLTPLFESKPEVVAKILGDLCAIYDGEFSRFTGSRGFIRYETSFPILAGVTPKALQRHQRNMNIAGPRFLQYRIPPLTDAEKAEGFATSWATQGKRAHRNVLHQAVADLANHLKNTPIPTIRSLSEQRDFINRLADLLAAGRAVASYVNAGNNNWEPESIQREEPWRAADQLRLLVFSLVFVHGRDVLTDHELEVARRVVFSTIPEDRMSVLELFQGRAGGITLKECADATRKSQRRTGQILKELEMAGVLTEGLPLGQAKTHVPVTRFDDLLREPLQLLDHAYDLAHNGWRWKRLILDP